MVRNCYVHYLQSVNFLDADFSKKDLSLTFMKDCDAFIQANRSEAIDQVGDIVRNNEQFSENTDCILKKLDNEKYFEHSLKMSVLGDSTLPEDEKKMKIAEVDEERKKVFYAVLYVCKSQQRYGEMFDQHLKHDEEESSHDGEVDSPADHCAKKYVKEKKLIDTNFYKLKFSPRNDPTAIDCEKVNEKRNDHFYDVLKKSLKKSNPEYKDGVIDCLIQKHRESNFIDEIMMVVALSSLNITDVQRMKERKDFIDQMMKIEATLTQCHGN